MTPKKQAAPKVVTVPSTPTLPTGPQIPADQLASDGEEVVAGLEEDTNAS